MFGNANRSSEIPTNLAVEFGLVFLAEDLSVLDCRDQLVGAFPHRSWHRSVRFQRLPEMDHLFYVYRTVCRHSSPVL